MTNPVPPKDGSGTRPIPPTGGSGAQHPKKSKEKRLRAKIKKMKKRIKELESRPPVYYPVISPGPMPPYVPTVTVPNAQPVESIQPFSPVRPSTTVGNY